jgi:hypothetical protein
MAIGFDLETAPKKQSAANVMETQGNVPEAAESTPGDVAPTNGAQARDVVKQRVWRAAGKIADGLVQAAAAGQLGVAKYLFEVAGVYPATEETSAGENSLAYILLKRLGLPTEMMPEENPGPGMVSGEGEGEGEAADTTSGDKEEVELRTTGQPRADIPTLATLSAVGGLKSRPGGADWLSTEGNTVE